MKRPIIFLKGLPSHELISLSKILPQNIQVYTHRDGSLDVADDTTVDGNEEIVCTTYDEFLTCWSEYKLWLLLET